MRIIFLSIMSVFYAVFLLKAFVQSRKGVKVFVMFKSKFRDKMQAVTLLSGVMVIALAATSVIFDCSVHDVLVIKVFGAAISITGTVVFVKAVVDMKSSWRVGVSENEKTALVTSGIYSLSRNPAYLGFDLLYVGINVAYLNLPLLIFTAVYIFALDRQIRIEEKFLSDSFGESYKKYFNETYRYLGRKR